VTRKGIRQRFIFVREAQSSKGTTKLQNQQKVARFQRRR